MESRLDWRRVFAWLEREYTAAEIASFFDLTPSQLGRRARAELGPQFLARYKTLVNTNCHRRYRNRIYSDKTRHSKFKKKIRIQERKKRKRWKDQGKVFPPRPRPPAEKYPWKKKAFAEQGGAKYPTVVRPECGTVPGYRKHDYRWEETCEPCRKAINELRRKQWNERKAREQAQADSQPRADHGEAGEDLAPLDEGPAGHPGRGGGGVVQEGMPGGPRRRSRSDPGGRYATKHKGEREARLRERGY